MHDPSLVAANKSLAATPASDDVTEPETARLPVQRQHRGRQTPGNDADRIRSAVTRLISSSVGELEELTAELHNLQEFLKSETERVQHEIDSVLSGMKIIMDTIAPWQSPGAPVPRNSPANLGQSARERIKRWPPPPAD